MILGDTNIDMLESNDQIYRTNIARTMPIYREILEDNGLSVQNKKKTWFRVNKKVLLDHITTNVPMHVSNINTEPMGKSDHHMVSFDLKTKENTDNPKFHYSQYWKMANTNDIELGISLNLDLREMWMENNTEKAWDKLIKASNHLCTLLCPE